MKVNPMNKKFTLASVVLLAAVSNIIIPSSSVWAVTTTIKNQVSNGEVVIYAQQAGPSSSTATGNAIGNNDGTQQSAGESSTSTATNNLTMSNVEFSATKITPTGAASAMVNSTGDVVPSAFTSDAASRKIQKTNVNGMTDFTGLTDGYWLFHQITLVGGVQTVKDFIVTVNTSDTANKGPLNVYPKQDMSKVKNLFDIVATNADDNYNGKTPNELVSPNADNTTLIDTNAADGSNTTTASAGSRVGWNVNTTFDKSQWTNTSDVVTAPDIPDNVKAKFTIEDTIPTGFTIGTPSLRAGTTALVPETDYTMTVTNQVVSVSLTTAGIKKVAALLDSSTPTINMNLYIPTTVSGTVTAGTYRDSAKTVITNAYGVDLSSTPKNSSVNIGGVQITKTNGTAAITASPSTFVLVRAKNEAAADALVKKYASAFNGSTSELSTLPVAYSATENASFVAKADGSIAVEGTGTSGIATFSGLNLVDTNTDTENTTNYYAVEVIAPDGYQLPTATTAANVTKVNASTTPSAHNNDIVINRPFPLPFTGGAGIVAIVLVAGVTGFAALVIRTKKEEAEEDAK
ncbi:SpaH/EbpB family LPXTG-anchored major pilin [Lactococcus garvieae]|uniref:Flagellar hook-length control protein FliK n=1 Tax=Lactococcus garvieae DCC43 TaxID=1231377 RepID=K2PXK4_9LACT|nr:SpaH/EbpB family LPXTG-anchored major pilin [Lactococcus garvieae]EKF52121.1 Flagellar hook-length control protein FliK [Lactococcus garvieae DCC43]